MQKKKREKIKSYRVYRQILGQVYHPQIELIPDMRVCVGGGVFTWVFK